MVAPVKAVPAVASETQQKERRVSALPTPYFNLEMSIKVAEAIHRDAGGSCDRGQLAALLKYNGVKNGSFLTRVTAAKLFGLIEQENDQLKITPQGRAIVAPVTPESETRAKVEAFLNVELFRKVYDEYKGTSLPANVGLKNLFETTHGIIKERVQSTINIMMDSADTAGFFKATGDRGRMVMPLKTGVPVAPKAPPLNNGDRREHDDSRGNGGGGSGNGGGEDGIPLAIRGLLKSLPTEGTPMSAPRRTKLVAAFTSAIEHLYPDPEEM